MARSVRPSVRVDVWSDVACPWCYVGKRRLESAVASLEAPSAIELVWRSFELDPSAPRLRDARNASVSYPQRLADKYGVTVEKARAMIDSTTKVAQKDGLDFRFDRIQSGNTFDAHRLLHLALDRGMQDVLKERLFRGYFTEGEPIGDRSALARLAAEAGLEPSEIERVLST